MEKQIYKMMSMGESARRKEKKLENNDMKNIMGKTSSCNLVIVE